MFTSENLSINSLDHLTIAGYDTVSLAAKYQTPLYLLDEERIRERLRMYKSAMTKHFGGASSPLFASKALSFKRIYEIMREEETGIDVVSPGELFTACEAGFPLERAYFHGNNKTDSDIAFAMDKKIGYFVCDSADEVKAVSSEARRRGIVQKILLRVTPGIDPHTHAAITTGKVDSKFGSAIETGQAEQLTRLALSLSGVALRGFHCHIGSQIFSIKPFCDAALIMLDFIAHIRDTLSWEADELNLGGGIGVRYVDEDPVIDYPSYIKAMADEIHRMCAETGVKMPKILLEPGRSIVADAGLTLYTIGTKKEIPGYKNYVSIDGGMPDNPRYALYQSRYTACIANKASLPRDYIASVAGRCCESGDLIGEDMPLQQCGRGDILAVMTTGAYNYSMASNYNRIPRPPVIMLSHDGDYVAVRRESFEDLVRCDV